MASAAVSPPPSIKLLNLICSVYVLTCLYIGLPDWAANDTKVAFSTIYNSIRYVFEATIQKADELDTDIYRCYINENNVSTSFVVKVVQIPSNPDQWKERCVSMISNLDYFIAEQLAYTPPSATSPTSVSTHWYHIMPFHENATPIGMHTQSMLIYNDTNI